MLLQPNKNANPDLTVLAVTAFLLKRLKKSRFESYTDLREALVAHNKNTSSLFVSSLNFLFILGLIDYHTKNDLVEYVGP